LYLHTDYELALGPANEENRGLQWGILDAWTGRKWIVDHHVADGPGPRPSLHDLTQDPGEVRDLAEDPRWLRAARPFQRLRGLVPERLEAHPGAPYVLPEEPWIRGSWEADGTGPAFGP